MGKKSKDKGGNGERELCGLLSKYLGGNFERTASSGARVGGRNAVRKSYMSEGQIRGYKSDILPPDNLPKLVAESKFYADFPYHRLVKGEEVPKLDEWISDLEYDCDENDVGLLCVKANFKGWFICIHKDLINHFTLKNYTIYNDYIITGLDTFFQDNKDVVTTMCS